MNDKITEHKLNGRTADFIKFALSFFSFFKTKLNRKNKINVMFALSSAQFRMIKLIMMQNK
jgi:hypothetical protein